MPRRLPLLTSRRLIWLAAFALIAVGILCLCLSGAVVGPGWWQGTLGAFGVGFTVGGIVDVLAISLLNQVLGGGGDREQRILNRAVQILLRQSEENEFAWGVPPPPRSGRRPY